MPLPTPTGTKASLRLGQRVTDSITKLKGVVTAIAEFAYAPPRILVAPPQIEKGEPKALWLDESRLEG